MDKKETLCIMVMSSGLMIMIIAYLDIVSILSCLFDPQDILIFAGQRHNATKEDKDGRKEDHAGDRFAGAYRPSKDDDTF